MAERLATWVWVGASALALVAGMVNVVGYLGFEHQAITHLTGTTTLLGAAAVAHALPSFDEVRRNWQPSDTTVVDRHGQFLQRLRTDGWIDAIAEDGGALDRHVWVAPGDGPDWLNGGTYLVARRIRMRIEPWDRTTVLLKDFGDYGNAAARSSPNNAVLFDVAPLSQTMETFTPGERFYTLVNHELAHVAIMDVWNKRDAFWRRFLAYVPVAVFAALIVPGMPGMDAADTLWRVAAAARAVVAKIAQVDGILSVRAV